MLGLSNQDIAEASGLHRSTVSRVVRGEYDKPELYDAVRKAIEQLALKKERKAV